MCGDVAHGGVEAGKWSDNLTMSFDNRHAGQFFTFSHMITLAATSTNSQGLIRVRGQYTGANVEIGAMSIVRVMDDTLVVNGGIKARHIQVDSLQAVSGVIGTLRTATSGGRQEISDNVTRVYDASNVLRVKIGNLDL
jgi:hypothetical protein